MPNEIWCIWIPENRNVIGIFDIADSFFYCKQKIERCVYRKDKRISPETIQPRLLTIYFSFRNIILINYNSMVHQKLCKHKLEPVNYKSSYFPFFVYTHDLW